MMWRLDASSRESGARGDEGLRGDRDTGKVGSGNDEAPHGRVGVAIPAMNEMDNLEFTFHCFLQWSTKWCSWTVTAPTLLLPLIAAFLLIPAQVAHFSVANLIVGALLAVPYFLSVGLFAAGAADLQHLRARVRQTLPLGLCVGALIAAVLQFVSSLVLQAFGASYASGGAIALRIMALAALPMVIKDHYIAIRRSQSRVGWAARATLVGAAVEIGAAFVGCRFWGIEGLCVGWVAALIWEGVVPGIPVLSFFPGVGPAPGGTKYRGDRAAWI